jgi:hypothetical protein
LQDLEFEVLHVSVAIGLPFESFNGPVNALGDAGGDLVDEVIFDGVPALFELPIPLDERHETTLGDPCSDFVKNDFGAIFVGLIKERNHAFLNQFEFSEAFVVLEHIIDVYFFFECSAVRLF